MRKFIVLFIVLTCMLALVGCGQEESLQQDDVEMTNTEFERLNVDYTINEDGTYTCRNQIYQYKMEVSGIEGESQVTFIVLTNDTEISFEEIHYDMIKAELSTGIPKYILLGWY